MSDPAETETKPVKNKVRDIFIRLLSANFSKTPGSSDRAYFKLLVKELGDYSEKTLKDAATKILREKRGQTWPVISVCIAACEAVRPQPKAEAKSGRKARAMGKPGFSDEVAVRILVGHDAQQALEAVLSGWHGPLVDFVREHKRVPDEAETEALIVQQMEIDRRLFGPVEAYERRRKEAQEARRAVPAPDLNLVHKKIAGEAVKKRRDAYARMIAEEALRVTEADNAKA